MSHYYYNPPHLRAVIGDSANSVSLSELTTHTRQIYEAFCDYTCARIGKLKRTQKHVANGTVMCPDCGNALVWKKKRQNTEVLFKK